MLKEFELLSRQLTLTLILKAKKKALEFPNMGSQQCGHRTTTSPSTLGVGKH